MNLGPEQLAAAQERLRVTCQSIAEAATNPIPVLTHANVSYDHNKMLFNSPGRPDSAIEPSYAPILYHLFLHQGKVIYPWEFRAVRGLAPLDNNASGAKVVIHRLRVAMWDFEEPYKYIQTIRSSRSDGPGNSY